MIKLAGRTRHFSLPDHRNLAKWHEIFPSRNRVGSEKLYHRTARNTSVFLDQLLLTDSMFPKGLDGW